MAGTVMFLKGLGDIVVGAILATKPQLIYESAATQALHAWTGLPLSSAEAAPSFNHAIACMVIAIGAGSIVAAAQDPQARIPVVIMNAIWGLLAVLDMCPSAPVGECDHGHDCYQPQRVFAGNARLDI
ncbi:hypothetical protein FA13DRAFT_1790998 [Coprinellus micaceus]|uniref:Uncharacterized protein n=1 Tax=Coprinellus micaceus TaxID=71717 RepID=A0A4Y7TDB4_COPMI|nr:hypothetical protein FA13DRAFT_1790998 [Coprinellus micaceus]